MEFTGKITSAAKTSIVKGDKEVVNFTVVLNDRYKPKGSNETKEYSTFINVAWWKGTNIAKILNKGSVVTVSGRIFPHAYADLQGNPKANINCFANEIKVVHFKKVEAPTVPNPNELTEPLEDLPF